MALGSIKLLNDYITSSTSGTKETPPSAALDNTVNPPSIANSTSRYGDVTPFMTIMFQLSCNNTFSQKILGDFRDAYVRNLQGLQNTLTQLQESIDEKQRLLLEIESKISSTKSLSAEKDVTESN